MCRCNPSNLDSFLLEVSAQCELFPEQHVWVVGLLEGCLQLCQLFLGEDGPMPSFPLAAVRQWRQEVGARQVRVTERAERGLAEGH